MGTVGRYELIEVLGWGSTGEVWRAQHVETEVEVAVKLLHPDLARDEDVRQRFRSEADVFAGGRLPGLVHVHELVEDGDRLALVLDLVKGPNLRTWLTEKGPLPPTTACALLAQVAEGVTAAHALGVVHRDLKPENVLIARGDDEPVALVTDFGLARLVDGSSRTRSSRVVGTPDYLAPEVLNGHRAAPPVDVYAMGLILFEVVTGWRLYRGDSYAAVLAQHLHGTPQRPEGLPDDLWADVVRAVSRTPEDRPTAEEFGARLRSLATTLREVPALPACTPPPVGEPALPTRTRIPRTGPPPDEDAPPVPRPRPPLRRRTAVLAVGGLLAALLTGGFVLESLSTGPAVALPGDVRAAGEGDVRRGGESSDETDDSEDEGSSGSPDLDQPPVPDGGAVPGDQLPPDAPGGGDRGSGGSTGDRTAGGGAGGGGAPPPQDGQVLPPTSGDRGDGQPPAARPAPTSTATQPPAPRPTQPQPPVPRPTQTQPLAPRPTETQPPVRSAPPQIAPELTEARAGGNCPGSLVRNGNHALPGGAGTVSIYYDGATGRNCALLTKARGSHYGEESYLAISLCNQQTGKCDRDWHYYPREAGPVSVEARDSCLTFTASMLDPNRTAWLVKDYGKSGIHCD